MDLSLILDIELFVIILISKHTIKAVHYTCITYLVPAAHVEECICRAVIVLGQSKCSLIYRWPRPTLLELVLVAGMGKPETRIWATCISLLG